MTKESMVRRQRRRESQRKRGAEDYLFFLADKGPCITYYLSVQTQHKRKTKVPTGYRRPVLRK